MSSIVVSASVRQNLLSLQSTASLLASTQDRLSTGNRVSSALDNPTNFFTSTALKNRASDISNLLDGIGNGLQILQTANTGISSLQRLVDTAKSIASQVLQTTIGYSAKSSATSAAITGATAGNLLGTGLSGETLTITSTGGGTATNITFGASGGQVSTLDQLNSALAANNLQASIDTAGKISLTTTNDAASSTIGAIGGTSAASGQAFNGLTGSSPVADAASQGVRSGLVGQYNNILAQITTTAQDSSFNGVNLLGGDALKLTFNETNTSSLNIQGVTFSPAGLGLSQLTSGTDLVDSNSAFTQITALNKASNSLRLEASTLGSNLSVVEIRQDFSKNLINVLQTGSANLTLADTNQEAANSQALSTRQSIAVSALALANQSQQGVLQLLR